MLGLIALCLHIHWAHNIKWECLMSYLSCHVTWISHSLEKFHQHMALGYAEIFFVISRYLWPPESKSELFKCVHVERSEIWAKICSCWSKNTFLTCFEAFTHFSLSIHIDYNFLIKISGDSLHTYHGMCVWSQKCEFSVFLVKMPIFHTK